MQAPRFFALLSQVVAPQPEATLSCHAFVGVHAHQHQPETAYPIRTFCVHLNTLADMQTC